MRAIVPHKAGLRIAAAAIAVALLSVNCVGPLGGGSEAGNARITGKVVDSQGAPVGKVCVTVRPSAFDPVKNPEAPGTFIDTTGTDGIYRISVEKGTAYSIEALYPVQSTRALVSEVIARESENTVPQCTVKTPGAIKVRIPTNVDFALGYVFIPGSSRFALLNNAREFVVLDSVPAGTVPAISYSSINTPVYSILRYNVSVESADTAVVNNPFWMHARRLILNTSPSGADVVNDVMNFPVCIRLTSADFVFSEARPGGADIRFSKVDDTPLPYEIERWDAANRQADIWVSVDTVHGNDSTQQIMMYWGNDIVQDASNSAAVFDTSNGFIGVWHMNEAPSPGTASIKDRTANAYNATPFGSMAAASSIPGTIGNALAFNGKNDYLNAGNVPVPGNYSIGLWVQLDTLGDYQRFIFKDSSYTLWYDKDSVSVRMEHFSIDTWWKGLLQDGGTRVPMTTGAWYYLTATFDGTAIRLFTNSAEVSKSNTIAIFPRTNAIPLLFGQSRNNSFVNGIMDEIRIEGTARSADWIRLCYMNQRADDKLVVTLSP